ncbi:uncharacterized protein LOC143905771 [Temnothorax americanus]|uniref:uncharacterized protein LOC143905771 n=1 Tax=Temnothorax americanus TaxID=1964332 RepID=UPI004068E7AE
MTDELVNKFTWSGGAESRNFGDTKIANILYLAAQNCPFFKGPESKMEFKIDMQEVLRAAKQRIRNRIKKNAIVTEEQDPEDDGTDDEECTSEEMTEYESDN